MDSPFFFHFEGNPVGEGTTRRGTATPVHRPQRPATRRVGGLLGVAGRLSGTVSPFRAEQGTPHLGRQEHQAESPELYIDSPQLSQDVEALPEAWTP